ncbi:tyrosine-type recombinase/integrase [Acidihalobacter ferrooxydans]|uniref:Tyr recombinase domain-containing protein n=1 Tax=Acidihalobacter ferrooxydans TaxID=1765967 RepID=A0A1P8UHE0_9GAMM|nr:tyrosine-type recombinase/integrase [Acidihalobacter ferrooxydans]APZ43263.1 hypothetical protein BW247_09290 [Acidihalobacter ferrooxydans]
MNKSNTLQDFIAAHRQRGVKTSTINHSLQTVRRICNLAAGEWIDEHGLTWLEHAPKIKFLPVKDRRQPYPLGWEERRHLLQQLPEHLARMALFAANSGCREAEICALRWDWEVEVPEMNTSVFIIPETFVKNGEERLVVLNDVARSIIEGQRGQHPERVFVSRGRPVNGINNLSWKRGRIVAALAHIRDSDDCGGIEASVERADKDVIATVWGVKRGKRVESIYTWGEYAKERAAKGKPVERLQYKDYDVPQQMLAKARQRFIDEHWQAFAAFSRVRVHNLKHTFGRRLRAAGVGFEDRQDLLGHRSGRMTTHYSAAELGNLIEAANRVCGSKSRKSPALMVLKRKRG